MNLKRIIIKIYLALLDYDMLRVISEQLRLLSWASPAAWLWFGWHTADKSKTTFVIVFLWLWWQCLSLVFLKFAKIQQNGVK